MNSVRNDYDFSKIIINQNALEVSGNDVELLNGVQDPTRQFKGGGVNILAKMRKAPFERTKAAAIKAANKVFSSA